MDFALKNKVCLITGCDSGLGLGLVKGFLNRDAVVAAGLYDASASREKVAPALGLQMDVTRGDEVKAAVEATYEAYGRIDVLINNAGIYPRRCAEDMDFAEWRRIHDTNLDGTFRCCEAVIPHFRRQKKGVIINVGSVTLSLGMPELAHYASSKGGIVGLTRGLARDLGQYGIRVNGIHLGAVQTEGEMKLFPDQGAILKRMNEMQSLPGRLTPETVEPVFAFFASEASADVSGQFLTVDRGWVMGG